ncbi:hypothetical protein ACVXC9_002852 [Vibrio cholerae]
MGYQTSSRTDLNFGIKTSSSQKIEANGKYLLNNYDNNQPEIEVLPNVDYIELASWDSVMTASSFSSIKLPLNAQGTSHIKVNYKVNNPVSIFRYKNHSAPSDRYKWYLVYEGFHDVRVELPTTVDSTYDILAGYRQFSKTMNLITGSGQTSLAIDDHYRISMTRVATDASTHKLGLTGLRSTIVSCIFKCFNNASIHTFTGNISASTSINTFKLATEMAAGQSCMAEWYIGALDGTNTTFYRKYLMHFERTSATNTITVKVERWIHPFYADQ